MKSKRNCYLLIDYENVQNIDLSVLSSDLRVKIFVGERQKNIPFDLAQQAQQLGDRLEWIKIDGTGSNALDFHLTFYMGRIFSSDESAEFVILSKDKGFDPLVRHIKGLKRACRRVNSLLELSGSPSSPSSSEEARRVIELLSKIEKNKRPRKRSTLRQHISSLFQKRLSDTEIDSIVDHLFIEELISETSGRIDYGF